MKRLRYLPCFAVSTAMLFLLGCSDPVKAVQSDEMSASYDQAYWVKLFGDKPALYNQAVSYCQYNTTKPNCAAAINVWFQKGYAPVSQS